MLNVVFSLESVAILQKKKINIKNRYCTYQNRPMYTLVKSEETNFAFVATKSILFKQLSYPLFSFLKSNILKFLVLIHSDRIFHILTNIKNSILLFFLFFKLSTIFDYDANAKFQKT